MISLKQNQIEELERKMEDFNKDRLREEMKVWNNYPFQKPKISTQSNKKYNTEGTQFVNEIF
jgi:hypothetical protein